MTQMDLTQFTQNLIMLINRVCVCVRERERESARERERALSLQIFVTTLWISLWLTSYSSYYNISKLKTKFKGFSTETNVFIVKVGSSFSNL